MSDEQRQRNWHPDQLSVLTTKVSSLEEKAKTFVTKEEFRPVRILVYGFVALSLVTLLAALFSKVIK